VDGPAFRVTVRFLPNQSWIKPRQRTARILAHEQGHFDLAEVTARRLRAQLASLDLTCATGTAAFTKLVADFQNRDRELQRSYDRQTMFGTGSGAQRHWEARIKSWLRTKTP
jgi:predicted secreted Zn-dependent protease